MPNEDAWLEKVPGIKDIVDDTAGGAIVLPRDTALVLKGAVTITKTARGIELVFTGVGGGTDHNALSNLTVGDVHTQYELARRPLSVYSGAANSAALADARKCITTSHGSANTFTIPPQSSVAWLADTLNGGINVGAGAMTLTAGAGVTLNGITLVVPSKAWWQAKRRSADVWDVVVLGAGAGGAGDFKADGTVPATGDFNLGGNQLTNVGTAGAANEAPPLSQVQALIAAAIAGSGGGGGDGFTFTFSTSTADADPGAAGLRFNNATIGSVGFIYVDLTDSGGSDLTAWLDRLDDSIGSIKGWIRVGSKSDRTKWALFKLSSVTSATGYRKLVVSGGFGTSLPTTTADDTFLSFESLGLASLVVDAVVDAAAAIAGTKIAPDFGAQNVGTTGYAFLGSGTKPASGTLFRLPHGGTAYFQNQANSAPIRLFGIGDDGNDIVNWGDTFYGLEWSEVAAGRVVLGLCVGSKLTTTMMPASTGSRVVYIAEAATQPSTGKPSGGIVVWTGDDRLRAKTASHPTNGAWDMVPNSSFSRYYPPEGAIETSSTSLVTVQTVDTSLLPDECSGIIRTYMSCADTGSLACQVITSSFARRAGVLQSSGAGVLKDGAQTQGVASFAYSSDNLLVQVTPTGSTNYRWTVLTEIIYSSHTNAE